MPIRRFPDPRNTTAEGLLALGGDLHVDTLVAAYTSGIFPWPMEGLPLPWFCPPERAILEYDRLHLSRSLRRARKQTTFRLTIDQAFTAVIKRCATTPRVSRITGAESGTWITGAIIESYTRLHRMGMAHSVECWDGESLVGGIYGVSIGGTFSAESMFRTAPNASKLALVHLAEHLHARGLDWLDVQVMSPHLEALGAHPVPRDDFLALLKATQAKKLQLFD